MRLYTAVGGLPADCQWHRLPQNLSWRSHPRFSCPLTAGYSALRWIGAYPRRQPPRSVAKFQLSKNALHGVSEAGAPVKAIGLANLTLQIHITLRFSRQSIELTAFQSLKDLPFMKSQL